VLNIKFLLYISSTICFPKRFDYRSSKIVCIKYHFRIWISSSSSYYLHQRSCRPQKTFFVSVQYADKTHFRQIYSFSQKIYSNQDIYLSRLKFFDNFPAVYSIYLAVQIISFVSLGNQKI